jgi:maleylpyruvate isomerase
MSSDPAPEWDPGDLAGLDVSAQAFTRTVDALAPDELAAPSLLPGWSRAHVVAHVALQGFALAGVLDGIVHDRPVAMYESDEQRAEQIDALAQSDPSELREQHLAATTAFAEAVEALHDEHWDGHIDRLPGGPSWPAVSAVPMRRREVEVHHADLGTPYTRADWPADFVAELLDVVVVDHADAGPFQVRATDLGRDWAVGGDSGPIVMGAGADLGWWLTGRGQGEGLSCDAGELPRLGPWRRAAARTPN